jgi:putative DNA methylase
MTQKKKLIEVSLPLEVINTEAAREKNIRQGHPSTLHLYWARRPLAAARAVLFAQLVDDPSARPEEFPTVALQDEERARLHRLVEKLVVWENSGDDALIEEAREEIRKSNNGELPAVLDPFAGGGAIPLEAHRLGLDANASDLNPLAVLINKSLIEIPPTVAGKPPVFPGLASTRIGWDRAEGLAADVRAYGEWMKERAQERIGHLYPDATLPDGSNAPVIAWLWARTVTCPNPACGLSMPLVKSWWLSKKKGDEAYIAPSVVDDPSDPLGRRVHFAVRSPKASAQGAPEEGTVGRQGARCVGCESAVPLSYVRAEAQAGRMHQQLMAIVAEANRRRVYLEPSMEHSQAADVARPETVPIGSLPPHSVSPNSNQTVRIYGFTEFADLFTNRQLTTLTTLNGLVAEARERIRGDAERSIRGDRGLKDSDANENERALNYANAVATYLALGVSRLTDISNALCRWENTKTQVRNLFGRQNIPMVWDFAEAPPFGNAAGSFLVSLGSLAKAIDRLPTDNSGRALQADASTRDYSGVVVSTDPPYYDNIGYSDLSDFFYIWLRQSLESIYPELLSTVLVPKTDELVANPHRLGGKQKAEEFFVSGFNRVFKNVREGYADSDDRLLTVYYAYKQQEVGDTGASSSTGWHTLLDGLIDTGWEITATWPMRTETANRMIASGANALASSIVLACRPRPSDAPTTTRRALAAALRIELPDALRTLIQGSIAAVDLDQAAIGPGIAVFSRYSRVREADGTDMTVRDALELINTILDEVVDELSDSDADSRFAAKWYRQFGWGTAASGTAITMAQSAGTSLGALERGGIFEAKGGRARLLSPTALEDAWDVLADERVSVWEATVRLASVMARDGADRVAQLIPDVQERVSLGAVKQMSLWLFREAEKKRDTKDAILFNGLVSAWGDVNEQARKHAGAPRAIQQAFDFDEDGD